MVAKVIVVDDEADIVNEILEALADEGYECVGAKSVDAAMETLEKDPDIRIVVTDLKMPGKSGTDLIVEARQAFDREFCFIVISGHENSSVDVDMEQLEIFDLLRKPIDTDVLLETVRRADRGLN